MEITKKIYLTNLHLIYQKILLQLVLEVYIKNILIIVTIGFEINTLNQKNIQVNYLDILYSQKHIILFIKKILKKYQLKYSKIWLCGFSQGAYLANIISLDDIIKINYVLSLSGFILNNTVIKNNKSIFFISHGLYDSIISIELAKKMVVSLSKHKVKLTYKTYLMDHEINQTNYQDLMQWIHINNMQ